MAKCPQNSECINRIGTYTCECNPGFKLDGSLCVGN